MNFLLKLIKVLLCVVVFLSVSYLIKERDLLFKNDPTQNDHALIEQEPNTSNNTPTTKDTNHEPAVNHNSTSEDNHGMDENQSHQDMSNHQDEPESIDDRLTYDMAAIDKHSIGHLLKMIEVIDAFKLSPEANQEALYEELYSLNFMHLEKELKEKNDQVHQKIMTLLESINTHPDFADIKSVIVILDELQLILENITNIR